MRNTLSLFCSAVFFLLSCGREERVTADAFNVSGILLPEIIDCFDGDKIEVKVIGKNGPQSADQIRLSGEKEYTMPLDLVEKGRFVFTLAEGVQSGDYDFLIIRGGQHKRVGSLKLFVTAGIDIDSGSASVYGQVACGDKGIAGVVVSDGVEVAVTDEDGVYRLNSSKRFGYVFISVPSGYEPFANGVFPCYYKHLTAGADVPERKDFSLKLAEGQENHTMLVLGDIHLANRSNDDRKQFFEFIDDLTETVAATPGKVYGLTLGDLVWDAYWLLNSYSFPEYIRDINRIKNLKIYQTIGNHDHSMYYAGDEKTVAEYREYIGPNFYSFNIGNVHYVSIDDVKCTNSTPDIDDKGNDCYVRTYDGSIVDEVLDWLEKDLSYVDAGNLLVVTMHIPLYDEDGKWRMPATSANRFTSLIGKFNSTHLFTAHTHILYNVDALEDSKIFEHNAGAVCGTWWWSAVETPGLHIGQDGSPGGYTILNVSGTDISWQFKPTGQSVRNQFRTYDRNNIHITADNYIPYGNASSRGKLRAGLWGTASADNEVYLNIWNYDPQWTIEVTELLPDGTSAELSATRVSNVADPLHLICYTTKILNRDGTPTFATYDRTTSHLFKVKASAPDTTLEIKVTDRFGNVYSETMTRPKPFNTEIYIK